ncbi:putative pectinesterase/pectinesterase inhibitor 22 [Phtheirospermum japonicum]|uniref:Pectinesterase n=1 Tax=Phtheirospermum japonicum TaxID=374723 RepID=A0A830C766_9LAMI|nr:putative pectinesterase/pectinesterase inhibitor 22 [Phtheirospermum japonicum]
MHNTKKAIKPDVVVAKDGSGKYKTIAEALNVAPRHSNKRFVIYVKKGVYDENVRVEKEKWNVLIYGDGMDYTIVSSNRSNRTGSSTSSSATFGI